MPHDDATPAPPTSGTSTTPRILISGATGMIGHALRAACAQRGWEAVPLQRPAHKDQSGPVAPQNAILWDPGSPQPFADPDALEGFEAVVHLAGANIFAHRWTDSYKKVIRDSRTQPTSLLAMALARLQHKPRVLISASAVGIYGSRADEVLSDDAVPGKGFLAEVCQEWEAATAAAESAGIRVAHTRFGIVMSPAGGALKQMLPLFKTGLGGKLGDGKEWMSWITLDDLLAAILHIIDSESLSGPINCVAPEPARNSEFTEALGKALKRPAIIPAPAFALRAAFGEIADESLLASCRAVPSKLVASGFRFRQPAIGPALQALVHQRVSA